MQTPECLHVPKDNGWNASRELPPVPPGLSSTPQSSWQPYPVTCATTKPWVFKRPFLSKPSEPQESTPMVVESLDTPASSTSRVFGIFLNRLLLPHPDDEMLSVYEEDVSSIRDGNTVWVKVDPASILERHLVNLDCANPIFRDAQDRRHSSPILNIVSTATYLIGYASRGGSAF